MNCATALIRTIELGHDQTLMLEGSRGTRLRVLCGALWLTEEGRAGDVVVRRGAEVALESSGRSVIESMGKARVQVIEPARRWPRLRAGARIRTAVARAGLLLAATAISLGLLELATPGPVFTQATLSRTPHAAPIVNVPRPAKS